MKKTGAKTFEAALERMPSRLNWIIAHIPFDVAKVWGTRGSVKIRGEINGFAFRTSLFPTGRGTHYVLVNKQMQKGGRARPGHVAKFRLERDTEERVAKVPTELKRLLAEDRRLERWFTQLPYSIRKDMWNRITERKSRAARQRSAQNVAECLMGGMEGERELPPMLRIAFDRNPGAARGWEKMSPNQRRLHLLGIHYYRSPEARARRVERVVHEALARAEKIMRS